MIKVISFMQRKVSLLACVYWMDRKAVFWYHCLITLFQIWKLIQSFKRYNLAEDSISIINKNQYKPESISLQKIKEALKVEWLRNYMQSLKTRVISNLILVFPFSLQLQTTSLLLRMCLPCSGFSHCFQHVCPKIQSWESGIWSC